MATLTGNSIASTYTGLLSVSGAVGADTVEAVTDGAGTSTSLSLSQQRATITLGSGAGDDFIVDGTALVVEGDNNRVGIGQPSPLEALHVWEGGNTAEKTYSTAGAGVMITSYQSDAGSPYTKTTDIVANSDGTVPSEIRLFTKASGSSSATERMRIDSAGNATFAGTIFGRGGNGNINYGKGQDNNFWNIGSSYSSGDMILSLGASPDSSVNGSYDSSYGGSLGRSSIRLGNGTLKFLTASATTTAIGSSVTLTHALTIDSSQDVTVSTGNLVIGTHGKGIDFSANTDDYGTPASGAEILDDYEEGTWTASYGGSTDAGTYTKIGRMVYANVLITGASESFTAITGLPFTTSSSYNTGMIGRSLDADTIDSGGSVARLYVFGTSINFKDNGGTGTGADANHTVTTSADTVRLQITTVYEA